MIEEVCRPLGENQYLVLLHLRSCGDGGALTSRAAAQIWGIGAPAARAYRACRAMHWHGLVHRLSSNNERWYITDRGRAALEQELRRRRDG